MATEECSIHTWCAKCESHVTGCHTRLIYFLLKYAPFCIHSGVCLLDGVWSVWSYGKFIRSNKEKIERCNSYENLSPHDFIAVFVLYCSLHRLASPRSDPWFGTKFFTWWTVMLPLVTVFCSFKKLTLLLKCSSMMQHEKSFSSCKTT